MFMDVPRFFFSSQKIIKTYLMYQEDVMQKTFLNNSNITVPLS